MSRQMKLSAGYIAERGYAAGLIYLICIITNVILNEVL